MSYIVILEFVAPFAIISGLMLVVLVRRGSAEKKGLATMLVAVQEEETVFVEALRTFLQQTGLEGDALNESVQNFTRARRRLFRDLIERINTQQWQELAIITQRLAEFSALYHAIEVQAPPSEAESDEVSTQAEEALALHVEQQRVLKRENRRLKAEVHVSVSTLNSLFSEYASMFGEVSETETTMTVPEILEAMERFTKGEFKPPGVTTDMPPELEIEARATDATAQKAPNPSAPVVQAEDVNGTKPVKSSQQLDNSEPPVAVQQNSAAADSVQQAQQQSTDSESAPEAIAPDPSWDDAFDEAAKPEGDANEHEGKSPVDKPASERTETDTEQGLSSDPGPAAQSDTPLTDPAPNSTDTKPASEPSWDEAFDEIETKGKTPPEQKE